MCYRGWNIREEEILHGEKSKGKKINKNLGCKFGYNEWHVAFIFLSVAGEAGYYVHPRRCPPWALMETKKRPPSAQHCVEPFLYSVAW